MSRIPRDPNDDFRPELLAARREWTGQALPYLAGEPVPPSEARGNVEGMIGFAQVPVGIAGPLLLKGSYQGSYIVPFATTEGTMVASYARGFKLAAEAGGVEAWLVRDGLTVWPTLSFDTVAAALAAARFVEQNHETLVQRAESTTRHGKVSALEPQILGTRLVLKLTMTTGDAHGINLVTRAAGAVVAAIPGARQVLLHGVDVEKRATTHHWRGKWVVASLTLPGPLVRAQLRTTPAALAELWASYQLGFARMGTTNHAIQIANGLAGIYLATGQDVAYVAESCTATLSLEDRADDLVATLDLPNLHAATVGGGTQKGTAREAQSLIGAKSAPELACVIAGALLCGDVNLAASFLGDDFVGAHERLGRNRPV